MCAKVRPVEARAALAMLCVCCAVLAGCETAPAPVSQRRVEEYRRAAPAPATSTAQAASEQGATPPVPSATKGATPKPVPAPEPSSTNSVKTAASPSSKPPSTPEASAASSVKTVAPKSTGPKAAAAGDEVADGDSRPEFYTVKRGDTVYSIALDAGLDYKELAAWNQLDDANVIKVGQQLRLRPPPGWKPEASDAEAAVVRSAGSPPQVEAVPLEAPPVKSGPKGIKVAYSEQALAQLMRDPGKSPATEARPAADPKGPSNSPAPAASATPAPVSSLARPPTSAAVSTKPWDASVQVTPDSTRWIWPTAGKLLHPFNQGSNPKGVAIGGNLGQPVFASAAGKVVYSGSGLRGYGKLIIIKHDNTYLSVYAHNRELLVKEGERVSRGQRIAEMGNIDPELVGLHFEIRRLGKPVDPLEYLPQDGAS